MTSSAAAGAVHGAGGLLPHIPQVSVPVFAAVTGVGITFLLYCVLTSNKVFRHLRRLGLSILTAMVFAAAGVGYVDHVHHARLVANSAGPHSSVMSALLSAWGFGTLIVTIPVFVVATWFTRRRAARLGGGLRLRRARAVREFPGVPLGGWPE